GLDLPLERVALRRHLPGIHELLLEADELGLLALGVLAQELLGIFVLAAPSGRRGRFHGGRRRAARRCVRGGTGGRGGGRRRPHRRHAELRGLLRGTGGGNGSRRRDAARRLVGGRPFGGRRLRRRRREGAAGLGSVHADLLLGRQFTFGTVGRRADHGEIVVAVEVAHKPPPVRPAPKIL